MRYLFVAALAIAAVSAPVAASAYAGAAAISAPAQTSSVSFTLENNSEKTINRILYGQSSSDEWSDNILDYQVEPGDSVEVTIDDELEDCMYDFAYTFDDDTYYAERVNMCEIDGTNFEFTGG